MRFHSGNIDAEASRPDANVVPARRRARARVIIAHIARVLLGLIFFVFGLNAFVLFMPPPPVLPPFVQQFTSVEYASHFVYLPAAVQVICGILLLTNQYVPLAIVTLAAVLANILWFHVTMFPAGIAQAIVALVLWFIVAWSIRSTFTPLLVRKPEYR
ncbi:MAG: DoxX family membrane protein [Candidatus Eremiobacteraeota bacterium]|nr:DoxX family membrane protein [Candidatus Eremiobacteraeota bacterium]